jgi:Zn-finger domain-containing protein
VDSDDPTVKYTENTDYTILHQDVDGNTILSTSVLYESTKERTFIKFLPSNTIINGSTALVTYTINDSVAQLFQHYESEEQRSTTVDLLIKEAGKKYVNIAFDVKMKEMYTLDDVKKAKIQTVVSDFINTLLIGESVKESDIVNAVYSDVTVSSYLSYIKLPFRAFYVPTNITDAMTDTHDTNSYIAPGTTEYIKLNKFAITTVS